MTQGHSSILIASKRSLNRAKEVCKEGLHRSFGAGGPDLTWGELQDIERRRRKLLVSADSRSLLSILSHYDGTVIPLLLKNPQIWVLSLIYIASRIVAKMYAEQVPRVSFSAVGLLGAFLSLALVFFTSHANDRFQILYTNSMTSKARIIDMSLM